MEHFTWIRAWEGRVVEISLSSPVLWILDWHWRLKDSSYLHICIKSRWKYFFAFKKIHWHQGTNRTFFQSSSINKGLSVDCKCLNMPGNDFLIILFYKDVCINVCFTDACFLWSLVVADTGELTQGPCSKVEPSTALRHFWSPSRGDTLRFSRSLTLALWGLMLQAEWVFI